MDRIMNVILIIYYILVIYFHLNTIKNYYIRIDKFNLKNMENLFVFMFILLKIVMFVFFIREMLF